MTRRQATRVDPLTPEQRQVNMSRIRGRDTRPELLVRQGLHARGLRFRLHDRSLPGTPDLVFAGPRVVIFVHGCFWHGHDCALGVRPRSNAAFWSEKIDGNRARDEVAVDRLQALGWRFAIVWECALRGRQRLALDEVLDRLGAFVRSDAAYLELEGR